MKLTKALVACIDEGVKEEVVGVGYHFKHNNISVVTCYNTSVVLFSFDNTNTNVDIRPYESKSFPVLIGKGGKSLVSLKRRTGASDICMVDISFLTNFSSINYTTYKTTIPKDGICSHKKKYESHILIKRVLLLNRSISKRLVLCA
jgi:hypothetical protein